MPICRMLPLWGSTLLVSMLLVSTIVIAFVSAAQLATLPRRFLITEPEIISLLVCQLCGTVAVNRLAPIDKAPCVETTEL